MSKLNIDQKSIKALFQNKKTDFLIPDYQRPYAWDEEECSTLWSDVYSFAIPEDDYSKFKEDDEYFLGPIVKFKNDDGKLEVIDGQQRLTTLMLLLRAFYCKFSGMKDDKSKSTSENIEKCIWKTNEFDKPNLDELKINSEVATDDDKGEFLDILKTGVVNKDMKSRYAKNYQYFEGKIFEFLNKCPSYFAYLPTRIMNNCILLPIEAESQDTALRIFSTLNDRGKPLSDADIFKAQFYKYYKSKGKKDEFVEIWKELEEGTRSIFNTNSGSSMDELFTRYMYFERAKGGNKSSTTEGLRKFFEKDDYKLLKNDYALKNLELLCDFWNAISIQDSARFSEKILRDLYQLNYAPNGMWAYVTSVYFMANKDDNGLLDNEKFFNFLEKIIAFIWAYAIFNPGVNALRTPIFAEMIKIVNGEPVTFDDFKFEESKMRASIENFRFINARPITKSMLVWWAFSNDEQGLIPLETDVEVEHIFSKNRYKMRGNLSNEDVLEMLGNKAILEKRINIRASDYMFVDKIPYYKGVNVKGRHKEATKNSELLNLSENCKDFTEIEINKRNSDMIDGFISCLRSNKLLK